MKISMKLYEKKMMYKLFKNSVQLLLARND